MFDKVSSFGFAPSSQLQLSVLNPGASEKRAIALSVTPRIQEMNPANLLQVAIKTNDGIIYFNM